MNKKFNVAVDCIIFGFDHVEEKLKLLLIKRDFNPGKGSWSLMTGFLEPDESFDESAARTLRDKTGLKNIYLEQLHAYSSNAPGSRNRSVAIAYYALINIQDHPKLSTTHSAQWFSLEDKPELALDHDRMVEKSIVRLQRRTISKPIGFKLLPKKFTMRQLQRLYEEIWQQPFDRRNFSKKFNSLGILEKLPQKDMTSSKKGSFLFKFNQRQYEKMVNSGFTFLSSSKSSSTSSFR